MFNGSVLSLAHVHRYLVCSENKSNMNKQMHVIIWAKN